MDGWALFAKGEESGNVGIELLALLEWEVIDCYGMCLGVLVEFCGFGGRGGVLLWREGFGSGGEPILFVVGPPARHVSADVGMTVGGAASHEHFGGVE